MEDVSCSEESSRENHAGLVRIKNVMVSHGAILKRPAHSQRGWPCMLTVPTHRAPLLDSTCSQPKGLSWSQCARISSPSLSSSYSLFAHHVARAPTLCQAFLAAGNTKASPLGPPCASHKERDSLEESQTSLPFSLLLESMDCRLQLGGSCTLPGARAF